MNHATHLIVTVDYEIFGNGSGCLKRCIIEPTKKMMHIAEPFSMPLTLFVEALELMAMEKVGTPHIQAVRQQLSQAVTQHHDLQLHLHPQWINAAQDSQQIWKLHMDKWRIGDLDVSEIQHIVKEGKQWLEKITTTVPGRSVNVFRAGGWCIQPAKNLLSVLLQQGFKIDSTVAPGFWNLSRGEWIDFRHAPEHPFWSIDQDVCTVSPSKLLEIPIATGRITKMQHLAMLLEQRQKANHGLAPHCAGSYHGPNNRWQSLLGKLSKLSKIGHVMLDLSTMPADILIQITKQWIERFSHQSPSLPLVAIAHTKNFTHDSEKAMMTYLTWAKAQGILFSTYGQWLEFD
ncbi:hypothetical protein ACQZV8_10765 [Magnetococcales bacterium HHB-1]